MKLKLSDCCYGYVNVSPSKASKSSSNREYQENLIVEFAQKHGMKLMSIHYDECEDTPINDRPGYRGAIMRMTKGDALLVCKISRLTRSDQNICTALRNISEKQCVLFSITEKLNTTVRMGSFTIKVNVFKKRLKDSDDEINETS